MKKLESKIKEVVTEFCIDEELITYFLKRNKIKYEEIVEKTIEKIVIKKIEDRIYTAFKDDRYDRGYAGKKIHNFIDDIVDDFLMKKREDIKKSIKEILEKKMGNVKLSTINLDCEINGNFKI